MKLKEIISEKVTAKGSSLRFTGSQSITMPIEKIPMEKERFSMLFTNNVEDFLIYRKKGTMIYGSNSTEKMDFKNIGELTDYLNQNKYNYAGIVRR